MGSDVVDGLPAIRKKGAKIPDNRPQRNVRLRRGKRQQRLASSAVSIKMDCGKGDGDGSSRNSVRRKIRVLRGVACRRIAWHFSLRLPWIIHGCISATNASMSVTRFLRSVAARRFARAGFLPGPSRSYSPQLELIKHEIEALDKLGK
jgi:hypothetical protein